MFCMSMEAEFNLDFGYIQTNTLSDFSIEIYVVGTHLKCLTEGLLISTHNICFHGEINKSL